VSHGHDLRARGEQPLELLHDDLALVVEGSHAQPRSFFLAQHLPGHDVRVVLEPGDEDLVPGADVAPPVGLGDEVDAGGGPAGEDRLLHRGRAHELLGLDPRRLVGVRRLHGEEMHAAMDVRVVLRVGALLRLDHDPRLLRAGRVVEIHERMAVHGLGQDGEVAAQRGHVQEGLEALGPLGLRRRAHTAASFMSTGPGSRRCRCSVSAARSSSTPIRWTTSLANAYVSRARAASSPMPRERR
jgi:hypothetical protein